MGEREIKLQLDTVSFKACKICGTVWHSRDDFLNDPNISIVGYQAHFDVLSEGFFLFNHHCRGTLSVRVKELSDLYDGPVFKERKTGLEDCPGYCLYKEELGACPAKCECAFVREIIQIVKGRQTTDRQ